MSLSSFQTWSSPVGMNLSCSTWGDKYGGLDIHRPRQIRSDDNKAHLSLCCVKRWLGSRYCLFKLTSTVLILLLAKFTVIGGIGWNALILHEPPSRWFFIAVWVCNHPCTSREDHWRLIKLPPVLSSLVDILSGLCAIFLNVAIGRHIFQSFPLVMPFQPKGILWIRGFKYSCLCLSYLSLSNYVL